MKNTVIFLRVKWSCVLWNFQRGPVNPVIHLPLHLNVIYLKEIRNACTNNVQERGALNLYWGRKVKSESTNKLDSFNWRSLCIIAGAECNGFVAMSGTFPQCNRQVRQYLPSMMQRKALDTNFSRRAVNKPAANFYFIWKLLTRLGTSTFYVSNIKYLQ